ncbi:hypothetical protein J6590_029188 [Homalodisca vitripennis]|nr:hypothetical protein J6590_029188 [Homalodisca vitripennis]
MSDSTHEVVPFHCHFHNLTIYRCKRLWRTSNSSVTLVTVHEPPTLRFWRTVVGWKVHLETTGLDQTRYSLALCGRTMEGHPSQINMSPIHRCSDQSIKGDLNPQTCPCNPASGLPRSSTTSPSIHHGRSVSPSSLKRQRI